MCHLISGSVNICIPCLMTSISFIERQLSYEMEELLISALWPTPLPIKVQYTGSIQRQRRSTTAALLWLQMSTWDRLGFRLWIPLHWRRRRFSLVWTFAGQNASVSFPGSNRELVGQSARESSTARERHLESSLSSRYKWALFARASRGHVVQSDYEGVNRQPRRPPQS